jgi:hypothetical protein
MTSRAPWSAIGVKITRLRSVGGEQIIRERGHPQGTCATSRQKAALVVLPDVALKRPAEASAGAARHPRSSRRARNAPSAVTCSAAADWLQFEVVYL